MIRFKPRSIPSMPRAADQMVATVVTESRAAGDTVWDVLDYRFNQRVDAGGKKLCHHVHQILRADGGDELDQRQQNHDKRCGGENDKKEAWAAYTVTSSLMKSL